MTVPAEDLLEPAEVAQLFHVTERTLRRWRTRNYGPRFLKVGRQVSYRRSSVLAWLDSVESQER